MHLLLIKMIVWCWLQVMVWLLLIIGGFAVGCRLSCTSDSDTGAAVWHWWHCQWHGHLHVHSGVINSWCGWVCWLEESGQFGTDAEPGWSHRGQTLRCAACTASAVPWCEYRAAACLMACNYSWLPQLEQWVFSLFMLAECRPNCQPPHSSHKTTQTQILLL